MQQTCIAQVTAPMECCQQSAARVVFHTEFWKKLMPVHPVMLTEMNCLLIIRMRCVAFDPILINIVPKHQRETLHISRMTYILRLTTATSAILGALSLPSVVSVFFVISQTSQGMRSLRPAQRLTSSLRSTPAVVRHHTQMCGGASTAEWNLRTLTVPTHSMMTLDSRHSPWHMQKANRCTTPIRTPFPQRYPFTHPCSTRVRFQRISTREPPCPVILIREVAPQSLHDTQSRTVPGPSPHTAPWMPSEYRWRRCGTVVRPWPHGPCQRRLDKAAEQASSQNTRGHEGVALADDAWVPSSTNDVLFRCG
eukprot:m.1208289 g.1208289  ORF g.1208289 m.1208289 type:complete len:309 (-) comp24588_c0_seq56:2388-3314(-)